ncbi:MAG TPA: DUF389 domain-containing protein [Gemmatimonadaceae bacterium]|nr:DUF389 domain-containing protein [Gemmatimonadaceae bacterium]
MRHLQIHVPPESAALVARLAESHDAFAPLITRTASADDAPWATVTLQVANDRVGAMIEAVADQVPDVRVVLFPRGVLPIELPLDEVHRRLHDVSRRSTLELVLGSLQSLGSWRGMLAYAVLSGLVAAYAVMFDVSFLLVAAMLIAPMGAPALVCVVGSVLGDAPMVVRGAARFAAALAVLAAMAATLGVVSGVEISTATMQQVSNLSVWTVLLALAGGAAGAQALARSERESLVTGTASGFLVAVALSPPAAVLGLSLAIGRWDNVVLMGFVLALTFVGIVTGGWLSLAVLGVSARDSTAGRGRRDVRWVLFIAAAIASAGLVVWQAPQTTDYRKADLSRTAVREVRTAVGAVADAELVDASAHFIRPELRRDPRQAMLVEVVVEPTVSGSMGATTQDITTAVRDAVVDRLRVSMPDVTPFVRVAVIEAPR